jgi:outer membrane assembly lipoprotein YfiO
MPRTGWACLAVFIFASPLALAETALLAPQTWERGADNKWHAVEQPATQPTVSNEPVANPELDVIENLLAHHQGKAAKDRMIQWIKANPIAPDRDRGLFLLAEMYDQVGDKLRAFFHLDELMDTYPESRLFFPALEKQYAIADRFLRGYKRRFLGIPFISTEEEGVEILFRIQERAPGSPIAERSLLRTADFYYDDSQFDLAADAYSAYVHAYPRSPEVPRCRLREAFASLAQFRGLRFDATPVINAKTQLENINAEYPDLANRENVKDVLERIDGILAARVATTAEFYVRTHEPRAAVYNWRYLIENFPNTAEAARARKKLESAPKWALELPTPQGGRESEEKELTAPPRSRTVAPSTPTPKPAELVPPSVDTTNKETP